MDGRLQTLSNDHVIVQIGTLPPVEFLMDMGLELDGVWTKKRLAMSAAGLMVGVLVYFFAKHFVLRPEAAGDGKLLLPGLQWLVGTTLLGFAAFLTGTVLATILDRVHFAELPTVYPPTSQFVFAGAAFGTPIDAPVSLRLVVMKSWFVAFDLATLVLVVRLLRLANKPVGLCLVYGWCPLLMKEVANSGHLDAVAVFFTTLAMYLAARLIVLRGRFGQQSAAKIWLRINQKTTVVSEVAKVVKTFGSDESPKLLTSCATK